MKAMVLPFRTSDANCQRPFRTGGALAFLLIINLFLFPANALYTNNTVHQTKSPVAMIQLVEKDNGRTINIHRGDSFQITLAENATTGYRWAIEYYDKSVIDKISSDAQYPERAFGSGGTVDFVFHAKSIGMGKICLKQWRQWEGDASVINRLILQLKCYHDVKFLNAS